MKCLNGCTVIQWHCICFMPDVNCVSWLPQKKTAVRMTAERYLEGRSAVFALTSLKVMNMMNGCNVD